MPHSKRKNITYLFIAHDLGLVDLMCHQVAVMYLGNVVEWLEHGRIAEHCKHPYTKALMGAVFKVDFKPGKKIEPLEGESRVRWTCHRDVPLPAVASTAPSIAYRLSLS